MRPDQRDRISAAVSRLTACVLVLSVRSSDAGASGRMRSSDDGAGAARRRRAGGISAAAERRTGSLPSRGRRHLAISLRDLRGPYHDVWQGAAGQSWLAPLLDL